MTAEGRDSGSDTQEQEHLPIPGVAASTNGGPPERPADDPDATRQWDVDHDGPAADSPPESPAAEDGGQETVVLPVRAAKPEEDADDPAADDTVVIPPGDYDEPPAAEEPVPEPEPVEATPVTLSDHDRDRDAGEQTGAGNRLFAKSEESDSPALDPGRRISTQETVVMSVAIGGVLLLLLGLGFGLFMLAALNQLDLQSLPLTFVLVILLIFAVIAVLVYNLCARLMGRK